MECIFPAVVFIITSMVTQAEVGQRMTHAEIIKKNIWKVCRTHTETFLFGKLNSKKIFKSIQVMQSPRFKKNTFRERYYFFVLSRAWNKEKILNPHRQWGTKNCFPLSHETFFFISLPGLYYLSYSVTTPTSLWNAELKDTKNEYWIE